MTSNVLVYDCFSGISGDMHIGAMLDIGVPAEYLSAELAKLDVTDEFELQITTEAKMGITGTKATVAIQSKPNHARHLSDITAIINSADYPGSIAGRAIDMFQAIAVAEAKIHGTTVEAIHFHEVGATDSIVDIVAAAICLEHLQVEEIFCPVLELGGGMVQCAHGLMPVPAPATAELLRGVPCRYDGVDQEATTPTGAAILRCNVDQFCQPVGFVADRIGYGIGQKDFTSPNVLRVMLGHAATRPHEGYEFESNQLIECNIDDMAAEAFEPLLNALFASGARDVYMTPVIMKKSRPGTQLSVLCADDDVDRLLGILFMNSTTIGVRVHPVAKRMLTRETRKLSTTLGEVRVKFATLPDGSQRWKIEHDDVQAIASAGNLDYLSTKNQLTAEIAATCAEDENNEEGNQD